MAERSEAIKRVSRALFLHWLAIVSGKALPYGILKHKVLIVGVAFEQSEKLP